MAAAAVAPAVAAVPTWRLSRHRWVVESRLTRLQHNRRLVRRYDRKAEHFQAFADLGCLCRPKTRLLLLA
jgi:hypothetical protein